MTTRWTVVNRKLDHFLDDAPRYSADGELRSALFPAALRIEAWNWAQRVLCHHTPRQRKTVLEIDSGNRTAILPPDFFDVQGIFDSVNDRWWWPMTVRPGDIRYEDDTDVYEYWIWGRELMLESSVSYTAKSLTLYYWAYYPEVTYEEITDSESVTLHEEEIATPDWAELALAHLATASCLMPQEIFSSDINQYKIRVESGDPLDNPRMQSADFHLSWWNRLVDKFPPAYRAEVR